MKKRKNRPTTGSKSLSAPKGYIMVRAVQLRYFDRCQRERGDCAGHLLLTPRRGHLLHAGHSYRQRKTKKTRQMMKTTT